MSFVGHPNPAPLQQRSNQAVVATIAVVTGAVGALVGLFTPAFEFFVPAVFGIATIVLAIIGHAAKVRSWTALALAALALFEAVYGISQVHKAEQELNAITNDLPAATTDSDQIVNLKLGTTYVGPTLSVGLSKPVTYRPSDSAMVQQQTGRAVAFAITVKNNDKKQQFPAMDLDYEATSGNTQDQDVEDSANDVGTSMATILPGHTLTWKIAFSVPRIAKDITIQVSSLGGGKTLVFAGPLSP
ncbi:MAG TPA: DUF4352 domain-containing protein [Pseudonocardiaceae bacterium]|jgi:hypothetical protein|nr:DUF4352 domain-containing protein [Pseudonocardiaceae bacterium]